MTEPKLTPLLTGLDLEGRPVALYRGQVAVVHFYHDPDCPGCHGRPDLCRCAVETRIEIVAGHPVPAAGEVCRTVPPCAVKVDK